VTGWQYALLGALGGFLVEAVEFRAAIREAKGWPWLLEDEPGPAPMAVSIVLRLAASAGLAFAAGIGGQVAGPFGALAVGIAAPLVIEKMARQVPLETRQVPSAALRSLRIKEPPSGTSGKQAELKPTGGEEGAV
jgi:hypothetical protein